MNEPSQGIQRELLPYIHLLSTYSFPHLPQLHPEKVSEWLQDAPKITRDQAPFYWTYLDKPQDMTVLLIWQSTAHSAEFPSDGYIWTPQEIAVQFQVEGGYTLEMYHHKAGYAPGETIATHSRRRYRLLPARMSGPQTVQPDPGLWIVHYATAEPNERIPSNLIPVDLRLQQIMSTRQYLQSQGQIVQKDFMLHDRSNWPTIMFPRNRPQGSTAYVPSIPVTRIPQTMAYPTQVAVPGPPTKRIRTQNNPMQSILAPGMPVFDVDEEEDISRGDLFDHITPREISMSRYKQNHEWMEEVISSPYSIHRIIPSDLGLGIRGELSSLTSGIFDAPLDPDKDVSKHSYVGRLDPNKADEFRKRANDRIAQTRKEIEKMKAKHEKRLAQGQKASLMRIAEKELRTAVNQPYDTGSEFWRLEGRLEKDESGDVKIPPNAPPKVSDIVARVEASLGRKVVVVKELARIQDGGFENPQTTSSNNLASSNMDVNTMNAMSNLTSYQVGNSSNLTSGTISNFSLPPSNNHNYPSAAVSANTNEAAYFQSNTLSHQNDNQSLRTEVSHVGSWVPSYGNISVNENPIMSQTIQNLPTDSINGPLVITKAPGFNSYNTSSSDFPNLDNIEPSSGNLLTNCPRDNRLNDSNMDINLDTGGGLNVQDQSHNFGGS